jgi:hypothetical protein
MKLTKLALTCALTGALVACGGSSNNTVDSGGTTRTLAGVAAKGLIKNGIVQVFSYNAAGEKSTSPLVTTRTASDGSYSVNLGNNIGLFTIEVSADAGTTMADEISHADIAMPMGLTLRSVVQLDSASVTAINGYVTPFTDMLVNAALNAGGLTASNVATAKSAVIALLKFDPLETKPVNIDNAAAATPAEQAQSLMLSAISKLANDGSLDCNQSTVSEKIKCVVDTSTGKANLQNGVLILPNQSTFYKAVAAVFADPTVNKTTIASLESIGILPEETAPVVTVPVPVVENPIAAAKALFASLRTNIQAWAAAFSSDAPAQSVSALKADFDTAIAPLDRDLADWVLMSDKGVALFTNYASNGGQSDVSIFRNGSKIGQCSLNDVNNTQVTSPTAADNVYCRLAATYTKTIKLTPVSGSTTSFSYAANSKVTDGNFIDTPVAGTVSFARTGNTTTSVTIAGDMPARTRADGVKITDKETWNVSYAQTQAEEVYKYAISGDIAAIKGGAMVGKVALKDGSFIRVASADRTALNASDVKEVNLMLAVASKDSEVVGALSLNEFSPDKNGVNIVPTKLAFNGSFSNPNADIQSFSGTLIASIPNYATYDSNTVDSAMNFRKASITFAGTVKIPNRPELKLILNASNPAFGAQAFYGEYNDGTNDIIINATSGNGIQVVNVLTTNGVSMQFVTSAQTINVMNKNTVVASINTSSGMINYTDGSFESLK